MMVFFSWAAIIKQEDNIHKFSISTFKHMWQHELIDPINFCRKSKSLLLRQQGERQENYDTSKILGLRRTVELLYK